jgi:hypothetical protein
MTQRPESLIAIALRHGLRADMSVEDAAAELLRIANGEPRRIEQAIARVDKGSTRRPGPVGEYARQVLRLALTSSLYAPVRAGAAG